MGGKYSDRGVSPVETGGGWIGRRGGRGDRGEDRAKRPEGESECPARESVETGGGEIGRRVAGVTVAKIGQRDRRGIRSGRRVSPSRPGAVRSAGGVGWGTRADHGKHRTKRPQANSEWPARESVETGGR